MSFPTLPRLLAAAIFAVGTMLAAQAAEAAPGKVTASVNMRVGAGVSYARIATIPANSAIEIVSCPSWCLVRYAGLQGWVASRYVRTLHHGANGDTYRPIHDPGPGRSMRPDTRSELLPGAGGRAAITLRG